MQLKMTYPPGVMASREGVCNMILIRSIWRRKQPCYCNSQTRSCLSDSSLHKARERSVLALLPYLPLETYCPKTVTVDISRAFDLATCCTRQPLQISSLKSLNIYAKPLGYTLQARSLSREDGNEEEP